jgi:hypothetical protein
MAEGALPCERIGKMKVQEDTVGVQRDDGAGHSSL